MKSHVQSSILIKLFLQIFFTNTILHHFSFDHSLLNENDIVHFSRYYNVNTNELTVTPIAKIFAFLCLQSKMTRLNLTISDVAYIFNVFMHTFLCYELKSIFISSLLVSDTLQL